MFPMHRGAINVRQQINDDGTYSFFVIGGWPDEVLLSPELIGERFYRGPMKVTLDGVDVPNPVQGLRMRIGPPPDTPIKIEGPKGDKVRFVMENGEALYQHEGYDPHGYIILRKISSTLEPKP